MDPLQEEYLRAHGVNVSGPLRKWLKRARFQAHTLSAHPMERLRYENWVLCTIEDALDAEGNVQSLSWKEVPACIPDGAPVREPRLLRRGSVMGQTRAPDPHGAVLSPPAASSSARATLYEQVLQRAPPHLRAVADSAFAEVDDEVRRGIVSYDQLSVLTVLGRLQRLAQQQADLAGMHLHHPTQSAPLLQQQQPQHMVKQARATLLRAVLQMTPEHVRPFIYAEFETQIDQEVSRGAVRYEDIDPREVLRRATVGFEQSQRVKASPHNRQIPAQHHGKTRRGDVANAVVPARPSRPAKTSESAMFFAKLSSGAAIGSPAEEAQETVIVGHSEELERLYSRYEPQPADIRPPAVLTVAYEHIHRVAQELESRQGRPAALKYLNDQLKGMRQDIRVQNIIDDFAVRVYETHATVALEKGELGEFTQCQAALKGMYAHPAVNQQQHRLVEFFCYRLLYLSLTGQFDTLSTEIIEYASRPRSSPLWELYSRGRDSIVAALELANACERGDIAAVCALLQHFSPHMTQLLNLFLLRQRVTWLQQSLTPMRGRVPLAYVLFILGFTGHPLHSTHTKPSKKSKLFYLEGSADAARESFYGLVKTLNITLSVEAPASLFQRPYTPAPVADGVTVDATEWSSKANDYIAYLSTRTDANIH